MINYKELSKSKGYKSLKKDIIYWTQKDDLRSKKEYYKKFKWVMGRLTHYHIKTGLNPADILNAWEEHRSYWIMNYYQDSNQPKLRLDNKNILIYDDRESAMQMFKDGFICPNCGEITKDPYECKLCNWKSYGLFGTLNKGTFIFLKDKCRGEWIFTPVALNG